MTKQATRKHWQVMMVCCGLSAASIGLIINAMGVFYIPVAQSLGVLQGTIAIQGTLTLMLGSFMSFVIPKLLDRYPLRLVLWCSVLVASISTMLMGTASHILVFHGLSAVRGVAAAFFSFVPLTLIVTRWFEKKHGLVTSLVLGLSGMAGGLFSPLFASLIGSHGWDVAYLVKGLAILGFSLPAMLYRFDLSPQTQGLAPYGYEAPTETVKAGASLDAPLVLKSKRFAAFLGFVIIAGSVTGIAQHLPGFALSIGQPLETGALLLSAAMVGNVLFKVVIGLLSDSVGPVKACLAMTVINIVGIVMFLSVTTAQWLMVGAFLFGASFSVGSVGAALLTRHLFGNEHYGKVIPFVGLMGGSGVAVFLMVVGYLYDFTGTHTLTFWVVLVGHGIGLALFAKALRQPASVD